MKSFLKEQWGAILFIIIIASLVTWVIFTVIQDRRRMDIEKSYCGPVIDKGYDPPSSGHKSHTDAQYWLVINDRDIHKGIRIHVTPACYYSVDLGKQACFILSGYEMSEYGNTNNFEHLK